MTISERQLRLALGECQPRAEDRRGELALLAGQANRELDVWGHAGCEVSLERASPFFGDAAVLSCRFWCETCHVSHLALLSRAQAG